MVNVDQAAHKWAVKADILAHGRRLVGRTLRAVRGEKPVPQAELDAVIGGRSRASLGTVLERYYYGINPPNDSGVPDFPQAGVELKSTPIKTTRSGPSAKERLVLNLINYREEAGKKFEESSFVKKNAAIMLVSYQHEAGRAVGDLPVRLAEMVEFAALPPEDQKIIRDDWAKIQAKIAANRAHELSEGDTLYLGACTKAATGKTRTLQLDGTEAKPRAYAFKGSYMTAITRRLLGLAATGEAALAAADVAALQTFEEIILGRVAPFSGLEVGEIARRLGGVNLEAKGGYAALARRMLGVRGGAVAEFEAAGVAMKTVRLDASGLPEEAMSFPKFRFADLLAEDWDAPDADDASGRTPASLKSALSRRFFFVVYRHTDDGRLVFERAFFWTMPVADIEGPARAAWQEAVAAVRGSNPLLFPKYSQNPVVHVRPHGRLRTDVDTLPDGTETTKRCFWLGKSYIKKVIDSAR